jgi:hypothetical protein
MDGDQERLNGALVDLSDANGAVIDGIKHDATVDRVIQDDCSSRFSHFGFYMASKVRVSVSHPSGTCGYLNMADVQVMRICQSHEPDAFLTGAHCSNGKRSAKCQSEAQPGMVAIKTTDEEAVLSMTKCESDPCWMVDLETRRDVSEVVLFNRRDCCFDQLNGVLVELMDSFGNPLTFSSAWCRGLRLVGKVLGSKRPIRQSFQRNLHAIGPC